MVYIYAILLLLAILSGWAMLHHVPTFPTSHSKKAKQSNLSIIIPARNEESNLPLLLSSLKKQSEQPLEIIIVDDHSTDQTAMVAQQFGARVIQFEADDSKWVGKSAACWYGARAASGDQLLFLDADIVLANPESLSQILAYYDRLGPQAVLSIQPYHVIERLYENLSVVFNIMVLAGMNHFSLLSNKLETAGAFGPSLLCRKDTYFEVGGHQAVKHSIMENVALGALFMEKGYQLDLLSGQSSLHFRMYPDGLTSLFEGWSKSFASGSKATHPIVFVWTGLWITGAFANVFFLLYALFTAKAVFISTALIGYGLYFLQFYRMARKAGHFSAIALFFYPILFIAFIFLFSWSAIQTFIFKKVSWKGRKINL